MKPHLASVSSRRQTSTHETRTAAPAVQTLCALQHLDYPEPRVHGDEQLFATIDAMVQDPALAQAKEQAFRRMALNQMASNYNDHTKNFGYIMRQGGGWELSPAYDVMYADKADSQWISAHQMIVNSKFSDVTRADMMTVARQFGVPGAQALLEQVAEGGDGVARAGR
jgi:serine/threonine-protein kinase HipA